MRNLISSEVHQISGGEWNDWQVVAITAGSAAIYSGVAALINAKSILEGLATVGLCTLGPAAISAAGIYGINSFNACKSESESETVIE